MADAPLQPPLTPAQLTEAEALYRDLLLLWQSGVKRVMVYNEPGEMGTATVGQRRLVGSRTRVMLG